MTLLMRSKLFVPASSPSFFLKALASEADAVCFDLEDSVLRTRLTEARENLRQLFSSRLNTKKIVMVRVNPVPSGDFTGDLAALVSSVVSVVVVPKTSDPKEIRAAVAALATLEKERRLERPIRILATIESSRGLRLARAIAESDQRVVGLQLGLADLFGELGIRQDNASVAQQVRFRLRLSASEAGVPCYDSAYADFKNEEEFTREAMQARNFGFAGKSCIHPSQISAANLIFSPSTEEIDESRCILEGARAAGSTGAGAFALNGRMVDAPFVKRAEEVLQLAEQIQVLGQK